MEGSIPKNSERSSNSIDKLKRRREDRDDILENKNVPVLKNIKKIATTKTVSQSVVSLDTVLDPPNACSSMSTEKNNLNPNHSTNEISSEPRNKNKLDTAHGDTTKEEIKTYIKTEKTVSQSVDSLETFFFPPYEGSSASTYNNILASAYYVAENTGDNMGLKKEKITSQKEKNFATKEERKVKGLERKIKTESVDSFETVPDPQNKCYSESTSNNYVYTGQYTNEMFSVSSNLNNLEFSHDVAENNGVKVELHSDLFQSSNMHEQLRVERRKKRTKRKQRYYTGKSKTRKSRTGLRKDTIESDEKCTSNREYSNGMHIDQSIVYNTNALTFVHLNFLIQNVLKAVQKDATKGKIKNNRNADHYTKKKSSGSTNLNNLDSHHHIAENTGNKIHLHSDVSKSSLLKKSIKPKSRTPKMNESLSNIISKLKRRVEEIDDALETEIFPALNKMKIIATEKIVSQSVDSSETVPDPPNECSSESRNKNNLYPNLHTGEGSSASTYNNILASAYYVAENTGDNIELKKEKSTPQKGKKDATKEERKVKGLERKIKTESVDSSETVPDPQNKFYSESTSNNYLYTGQYTNEMFSVSSNLNNLEFSHDVAENNGVKVELHSDLFQSSNMHEQRRVERRNKRTKRKQSYYYGKRKTRKRGRGLRKGTTKSDEKCASNIEHSRNIHIDQNIDSNTNAFFADRLNFLFQKVLKTVLNVLDPPHECSSGAAKNVLNPGHDTNEISSTLTNKNNLDSVYEVVENTGDKIQLHSELTQSSLLENDLSQSSLLIPKESERLSNIISKLKRRLEENDDDLETKFFPA
ncbi:uncharacterized protein LOC129959381 [Argiope bruennichi]|uniref:uncharacterized protein LOC129959381 n=1 Tax=Argiope bruennichi TaxID=94029 RepID=UPI0024940A7E|nr:uncharacterized protein LOC129959381 [Argiope bruennichi]